MPLPSQTAIYPVLLKVLVVPPSRRCDAACSWQPGRADSIATSQQGLSTGFPPPPPPAGRWPAVVAESSSAFIRRPMRAPSGGRPG